MVQVQMLRMQKGSLTKRFRNLAAGNLRMLELHGERKADACNKKFRYRSERQD